MPRERFDVIVIGTGPGGEGAAMKAAKEGCRVAVIERYVKVGGSCTHWGTIPSKSLRHAIHQLVQIKESPLFEHQLLPDFPKLLTEAASVIRSQVNMRQGFYARNGAQIIEGEARFIDEHCVEVLNAVRQDCFEAEHFIIATGSRPYHPPFIDFNHPHVRDSDSILELDYNPRSVTVYGAGVIGSEYASIFRGLGTRVNLVNTRQRLLDFMDDEIVDALAYHLRNNGVLLRHGESAEHAEYHDDGVTLHLKSGKRIKSDILFWANGRSGNSDNLGLETLGIEYDHRGQIKVDECYRSSLPHIYAVGDVVGRPGLASSAYDQGRFAAGHLMDHPDQHLLKEIPTGIYTSPEISSIGRTERELTEARVPYEVGKSLFRSLARAQITGQKVGMLKILFHLESLEILGVHCFGSQATEIIHIGQAIMSMPSPHNSLRYFLNTTFNYPTMAEAYRVAALNGLNRLS